MKATDYFGKEQQAQIVEAIQKAELTTSGEIRVHIEDVCEENVLERAAWAFEKLGMQHTQLRNGVLIYLAFESKKFAIIGDTGINEKVNAGFWNSTKEKMHQRFANGNFAEGIVEAIGEAGILLQKYFPFDKDSDLNEQPDEVSFGFDDETKS